MVSEGCSCCQDIKAHAEHTKQLAKLLNVCKYLDGSGYKLKYRWVKSNKPFEWEYIFLRQTSLNGFIEWLRRNKSKI